MPDRVSAGDAAGAKLRSARRYNETSDAIAIAKRLDRHDRYARRTVKKDKSPTRVKVTNKTGVRLEQYHVVGVDTPNFDVATNEEQYKQNVGFNASMPVMPRHECKFGIVQQPIDTNADQDLVGRAVVSGVTRVQIEITKAEHEFAKPVSGDPTKLISAESGSAYILERELPVGLAWCSVRLSNCTSDSSAEKNRVHIKGRLLQSLSPGEWGDMTDIRCLWGKMPTEDPVRVQNCTNDILAANLNYEAAFNCNCAFVITNCCPVVLPACPTCIEECEPTYHVILPSTFDGPCQCQAGQLIPLHLDTDCLYVTEPGGHEIAECVEGAPGENPCECDGDPNDPGNCTPDPADPDCRYCRGVPNPGPGDGPCFYCKANCGHGLRLVHGTLECDNNIWTLSLSSGTAGVCPDVAWTAEVAPDAGPYVANGRCPPNVMRMAFAVDSTCADEGLQCPESFEADVIILEGIEY